MISIRFKDALAETPRIDRKRIFIDRDFQVRYMMIFAGASILAMALMAIPVLYFVTENYLTFIDLASDKAPELMVHFEQERIWLVTVLLSGSVAFGVLALVLAYRLTGNMIGPVRVMQNHLLHLSRGSWGIPIVRIRSEDEFQSLIETYNYFYLSFRSQTRTELSQLESLRVDPEDRRSWGILNSLIESKRSQLELPSPTERSPQKPGGRTEPGASIAS